jgi:hypothetical protein
MALAGELAARVARSGGAALVVDYGRDTPYGNSLQVLLGKHFSFSQMLCRTWLAQILSKQPYRCTLLWRATLFFCDAQAIRNHGFVDMLSQPGLADLSARVDFSALRSVALTSNPWLVSECDGRAELLPNVRFPCITVSWP